MCAENLYKCKMCVKKEKWEEGMSIQDTQKNTKKFGKSVEGWGEEDMLFLNEYYKIGVQNWKN